MSPASKIQEEPYLKRKNKPKGSMPWWRAYAGMPSHPIWRLSARRSGQSVTSALSVGLSLIDHASSAKDRGNVSAFDIALCAAAMDLDDEVVAAIVTAFANIGWITEGRITNWEVRQPIEEDPGATERKQRQRAREAEQRAVNGHDDVTRGHGDVTARHDREEEMETETEIDSKENLLKCCPPSPDERLSFADVENAFAEAWAAYPSLGSRSNPRKPAREKYEILVRPKKGKPVDPAVILEGVKRYAATNPEPAYTKQMVTFLNQEVFADTFGENVVSISRYQLGRDYSANDLIRANGNERLAAMIKRGDAF